MEQKYRKFDQFYLTVSIIPSIIPKRNGISIFSLNFNNSKLSHMFSCFWVRVLDFLVACVGRRRRRPYLIIGTKLQAAEMFLRVTYRRTCQSNVSLGSFIIHPSQPASLSLVTSCMYYYRSYSKVCRLGKFSSGKENFGMNCI